MYHTQLKMSVKRANFKFMVILRYKIHTPLLYLYIVSFNYRCENIYVHNYWDDNIDGQNIMILLQGHGQQYNWPASAPSTIVQPHPPSTIDQPQPPVQLTSLSPQYNWPASAPSTIVQPQPPVQLSSLSPQYCCPASAPVQLLSFSPQYHCLASAHNNIA